MGSCCSGQSDEDADNKYGKAKTHDPSFNGPMHKRSCTDIICCLIFFIFILGFIVVGIFAWLNGDPIILLYPTDNQGRICGVEYGDLDLSNKTNVFFFDLSKCASPASILKFQCATTQICVNSCPTSAWTYYQDVPLLTAARVALGLAATNADIGNYAVTNLNLDWSKYICTYGYDIKAEFEKGSADVADLLNIIQQGKCAPYYIPMTPLVGRCIPTVLKDAASFVSEAVVDGVKVNTTVVDANNQTVTGSLLDKGSVAIQVYLNARAVGMNIFADFTVSWYWILAGLGIAALVSFLWIVIMRWVAGPMIWITIFALLAVFGFGIYYTYTEWQRLLNVDGADKSIIAVGFTSDLNQYLALTDTWLAFFIILCVLGGIFLLLIIFLRKRILIAIEIIKAASKAVGMMISTLFYPLVTFILAVIVTSFWAATALFLASSGDPVYRVIDTNQTRVDAQGADALNDTKCNITEWNQPNHTYSNDSSVKCAFIEYGGESVFHNNILWLQIICAFGVLWLLNWVIALGECTLAGAFASYYWAFKKPRDIPALPLFTAFGRTLRYHTGSLAFGAFIIALIQLIRLLLEYLDHKVKGSENKVAKFVIKCCKCCFWCLEKFMKFLNRNAYIMIAVYGKNFCWSAKEAFKLLMRNIIRVAVVDKVTDFLLLMGKLIVTAGLVALSWAFFSNEITFLDGYVPSLNYYWMPIIVIGIGAYIVAAGFFNTYGMAVDTIFLSFLEDLERNDGSEEKPYYMSKGLMELLGKKNKKAKPKKDDN